MSTRTAFVIVVISLIALIAGAFWTSTRPVPNTSTEMPDVSLAEFEDTLQRLEGQKPVVINFWASWCPPCRGEADDLEKAWQEYGGRVEFIGIDIQNDTVEGALDFAREFDISFRQIRDNTGRIGAKYRITGVPGTFLITKSGQHVDEFRGAVTFELLGASIEENLIN
ncbi:MAG: TlpA family protein disulfide reductase [Terriglobia bacterium]